MARYEAFANEMGFTFIPSYGNFITFLHSHIESSHLCDWLLQNGLIVRNLRSYGLNAFRITIGRAEQNTRVFELIKAYLQIHN